MYVWLAVMEALHKVEQERLISFELVENYLSPTIPEECLPFPRLTASRQGVESSGLIDW